MSIDSFKCTFRKIWELARTHNSWQWASCQQAPPRIRIKTDYRTRGFPIKRALHIIAKQAAMSAQKPKIFEKVHILLIGATPFFPGIFPRKFRVLTVITNSDPSSSKNVKIISSSSQQIFIPGYLSKNMKGYKISCHHTNGDKKASEM